MYNTEFVIFWGKYVYILYIVIITPWHRGTIVGEVQILDNNPDIAMG